MKCGKPAGSWCADCPNWPKDAFARATMEADLALDAVDRAKAEYRAVPRWRAFKSWRRFRRWGAALSAAEAAVTTMEKAIE